MLGLLRTRMTYANVVATLALFFAMSGGAYALVVNGALVQDESLTEADVKDGSLTSSIGRDAVSGVNVKDDSLSGDDIDEASLQLAEENAELRDRVAALEALLQGAKRNGNTLTLEGMNLQLVNGEGGTSTTNGLGNLIVGYNDTFGAQTGSHNVVIGDLHAFRSYAGLLAGQAHQVSAPFGTALGAFNVVTGHAGTVTAGSQNNAAAANSSVSGGIGNVANGTRSSVTGGNQNTASADRSSVSGGRANRATGEASSILGGHRITVSQAYGTHPTP